MSGQLTPWTIRPRQLAPINLQTTSPSFFYHYRYSELVFPDNGNVYIYFIVCLQILGSNSSNSAMETRLCVVGKENGENKELMQAIEV